MGDNQLLALSAFFKSTPFAEAEVFLVQLNNDDPSLCDIELSFHHTLQKKLDLIWDLFNDVKEFIGQIAQSLKLEEWFTAGRFFPIDKMADIAKKRPSLTWHEFVQDGLCNV